MTPTKDEIKVFLDIWNKLSQFEADHRCIRGWGVWNDHLPSELPIPEVVKVYKWLQDLSNENPDFDELLRIPSNIVMGLQIEKI